MPSSSATSAARKIIEREAAQAIDETELHRERARHRGALRRAAGCVPRKGHDLDPRTLSLQDRRRIPWALRGRSHADRGVPRHAPAALTRLPAHTLPSARGQGEPLSGRLDPPDGATFVGVIIGEPEDLWLVASDSGYGFTVRLKEMHSRNRAGKGVLHVPDNSKVLAPAPVPADPQSLVAVVSSEGKMLTFRVSDVPELPRGKGNKLFGISSKKFASRDEFVAAMTVVAPDRKLVLYSGDRRMTLDFKELAAYRGERGQRGAVLPRGWRNNIRLETAPG